MRQGSQAITKRTGSGAGRAPEHTPNSASKVAQHPLPADLGPSQEESEQLMGSWEPTMPPQPTAPTGLASALPNGGEWCFSRQSWWDASCRPISRGPKNNHAGTARCGHV